MNDHHEQSDHNKEEEDDDIFQQAFFLVELVSDYVVNDLCKEPCITNR